jgi:predicted nucleic acid-binding protein
LSVVLDSSVLVAALVDTGPDGAWSEEILETGSLHAPELARAEANAAHDDLMQLNLELFAFDPFAERIWKLRHAVTSYDAWYVAVAESLKLPLATLDVKLSKAKGPVCDFLTPPSQ